MSKSLKIRLAEHGKTGSCETFSIGYIFLFRAIFIVSYRLKEGD